jgi:Tfp pilus assembly protein FimT
LLELMIVIAVVGILSALIVPQFTGTMEDTRLVAAGRELASVMSLAYSQAITLHRPCRLRIDREKRSYWLEAPSESRGMGFEPVDDVPGSSGAIDRKLSVLVRAPGGPAEGRESAETLTFRPDGTADPREVILRDRDGFGLSIEVNPVTSRVRIDRIEKLEGER